MTCKVHVLCTIFLSATKLSFLFNSENVYWAMTGAWWLLLSVLWLLSHDWSMVTTAVSTVTTEPRLEHGDYCCQYCDYSNWATTGAWWLLLSVLWLLSHNCSMSQDCSIVTRELAMTEWATTSPHNPLYIYHMRTTCLAIIVLQRKHWADKTRGKKTASNLYMASDPFECIIIFPLL